MNHTFNGKQIWWMYNPKEFLNHLTEHVDKHHVDRNYSTGTVYHLPAVGMTTELVEQGFGHR